MRCSCRVTPASSPVLAWRLWLRRLISVDLPTFGTPQISTRMGLAMPPRGGARVGRQPVAVGYQLADGRRPGCVQCHGAGAVLGLVPGQPQRGALGVGQ